MFIEPVLRKESEHVLNLRVMLPRREEPVVQRQGMSSSQQISINYPIVDPVISLGDTKGY